MTRDIPLVHPGTLLKEEFIEPHGLTIYAVAKAINVPRSRVNEICRGNQGITASIALRLGKFFGVDAQWFLNMQDYYDLEMQREVLAADLDQIITFERAA